MGEGAAPYRGEGMAGRAAGAAAAGAGEAGGAAAAAAAGRGVGVSAITPYSRAFPRCFLAQLDCLLIVYKYTRTSAEHPRRLSISQQRSKYHEAHSVVYWRIARKHSALVSVRRCEGSTIDHRFK